MGSLFLIDTVNVWMSGDKGIQRGYVNNFSLTISHSVESSAV